MPILLVIFIIVPIIEMWLLIEVGQRIGALPTIGLVFLTAILGLALLRQQGVATLSRANQRLRSGELPATEMGEGIFLAVGGALLLTPGFFTDAVGFACLIPGLRRLLLGRLLKRVQVVQFGGRPPFDQGSGKSGERHTIEGDYRRED